MQTVLIAIHLLIVIALVAVVLLQRSEGGALGVGGGSGFMTGRGQANVLTRATAILAALFFATSLGLTLMARYGHGSRLDFNAVQRGTAEPASKLPPKQPGSVLDQVRAIEQQRTTSPAGADGEAPPQASVPPSVTPSTPASSTSTPAAVGAGTVNPPALNRGEGTVAEPTGMPNRPAPAAPAPANPAPSSATPAPVPAGSAPAR